MSETTATTTTQRRPRQPDCRLTDQQLANLITRERPYKVFDGNSLFVLVTPSGQQHGRENFTVVTRDQRLADVLYRARSAALSRPIKAHLTDTAASLGLTYGPNLYPEVIDLAHASKAELRARFPNWNPAW
jgi:hypothetical protein